MDTCTYLAHDAESAAPQAAAHLNVLEVLVAEHGLRLLGCQVGSSLAASALAQPQMSALVQCTEATTSPIPATTGLAAVTTTSTC